MTAVWGNTGKLLRRKESQRRVCSLGAAHRGNRPSWTIRAMSKDGLTMVAEAPRDRGRGQTPSRVICSAHEKRTSLWLGSRGHQRSRARTRCRALQVSQLIPTKNALIFLGLADFEMHHGEEMRLDIWSWDRCSNEVEIRLR